MSIEENTAVVRRYFLEFHGQRAWSIVDEIFNPDWREGVLGAARMMVMAFPDFRITIVAQVAEDDRVATVWKLDGTHQGDWPSPIGVIAATGKPVTFTATTTSLVHSGKIDGVLGSNWDHLGILQQLGALPNSAPRAGA